jgi:hypothetical protein
MRALIYFMVGALLLVGSVDAKRPSYTPHSPEMSLTLTPQGPFLRGYAEFATSFSVEVNGEPHEIIADDEGYFDFDLGQLKLDNGRYNFKVVPKNALGVAPTVEFDLAISGGKRNKLYQILPIPRLIRTDPDYLNYFSDDLSIRIPLGR